MVSSHVFLFHSHFLQPINIYHHNVFLQQIAVLASLTSVPPGLRANENAFVKTSFQNMALHPRAVTSPPALLPALLSLPQDNGLHSNRGYEEQDSLFADISSLSSSLMAKDSMSADQGDGPGSNQKKSNSYESLLLASRGMEGPSSLLNNGYSKGLGGHNDQHPPAMTWDMPPSLSKHPLLGLPGQGAMGVGGVGGVGHVHESASMTAEEAEEESTLLAAQQERAQFPSEFIDKLVAVLKRCGAEGLLGSQFPEAFKKLHGEKLVLENKKGNHH